MKIEDQVSRKALFTAIVSEATGFYKIVTVIASSFLGGSLLFMEKIAVKPKPWTLVILAGGWLLLMASIGLIAWIRCLNLDAGQMALEGKYDEASVVDRKKRRLSIAALVALMAGMTAIMALPRTDGGNHAAPDTMWKSRGNEKINA